LFVPLQGGSLGRGYHPIDPCFGGIDLAFPLALHRQFTSRVRGVERQMQSTARFAPEDETIDSDFHRRSGAQPIEIYLINGDRPERGELGSRGSPGRESPQEIEKGLSDRVFVANQFEVRGIDPDILQRSESVKDSTVSFDRSFLTHEGGRDVQRPPIVIRRLHPTSRPDDDPVLPEAVEQALTIVDLICYQRVCSH
jgi:hypothetical protein